MFNRLMPTAMLLVAVAAVTVNATSQVYAQQPAKNICDLPTAASNAVVATEPNNGIAISLMFFDGDRALRCRRHVNRGVLHVLR
jgi:uncharacterized membrane protein (DUF4010 family)